MNDNFYKDIMIQNYQVDNYYDPTKLFLTLGLITEGKLRERYTLYELSQYVYRYYMSNPELAKHNINIVIRNIQKYGVQDIVAVVENSIKQWIREQKFSSFKLANEVLILSIDDYSEKAALLVEKVCLTLFKKYYKVELKPVDTYDYEMALDDKNIDVFGKCNLRKLIFEDLQYCPLCENVVSSELYVTHILLKNEGLLEEESIDKDNLLLMCREEMQDYIAGKFYFDEFGRVVTMGSKLVNSKMRISQKIITKKRREFIKRRIEYLDLVRRM